MNKTVNLSLVGSVLLLAFAGNAQALALPSPGAADDLDSATLADVGALAGPKCEVDLDIDTDDFYVEAHSIPPVVHYDSGVDYFIRCTLTYLQQLVAADSSMAAANALAGPECHVDLDIDTDDFHVSIERIPPTVTIDSGIDAMVQCYLTYLRQFVASESAMANASTLAGPECHVDLDIDTDDFYVEVSRIPPVVHYDSGIDAMVQCYLAYLAQFVAAESTAAFAGPKCELDLDIDTDDFHVSIERIPPTVTIDSGIDYFVKCTLAYLAQSVNAAELARAT